MSSVTLTPQFPNMDVLARTFFEEGIRHLEDAYILHQAKRHPASIASAMKAAEFGVKTIIILDGAMGWWEKVFITHSPLGDINNLPIFEHHVRKIAAYNRTLGAEVIAMEKLSPKRPGGTYEVESQQNPEYPFLSFQPAVAGVVAEFHLNKPSEHFGEVDSKKYCNTAQDLLVAITTQYTAVDGWGIAPPEPL